MAQLYPPGSPAAATALSTLLAELSASPGATATPDTRRPQASRAFPPDPQTLASLPNHPADLPTLQRTTRPVRVLYNTTRIHRGARAPPADAYARTVKAVPPCGQNQSSRALPVRVDVIDRHGKISTTAAPAGCTTSASQPPTPAPQPYVLVHRHRRSPSTRPPGNTSAATPSTQTATTGATHKETPAAGRGPPDMRPQSRDSPVNSHATHDTAEGVGFEPTEERADGFQDRRHRPLGEPSHLRLSRSTPSLAFSLSVHVRSTAGSGPRRRPEPPSGPARPHPPRAVRSVERRRTSDGTPYLQPSTSSSRPDLIRTKPAGTCARLSGQPHLYGRTRSSSFRRIGHGGRAGVRAGLRREMEAAVCGTAAGASAAGARRSSSRHTRSPRKFGPQRALDEPEARLGQHDEHGNPGDITDHRMSERSEYRDSRQDIPEIDRIRPLAQPPHRAACQQRSNCRSRPRHDTDQHHERQSGPRDGHQGGAIGVVPICQDGQEGNGQQRTGRKISNRPRQPIVVNNNREQ